MGWSSIQITFNLDESLLNEAFQLTNLTTQEELMNLALQKFVRSRRKKNLLDLAGQIQFAPGFDYQALRENRHVAEGGENECFHYQ
ncbi:type II toxin-antitoxin system VapB family antitoxin [Nostoc sp. UHCC 0870]|uniref:type II toxin-antitoxin system VapB family antitoxin n=1 Tax=Nostoc sp. UHCC 0870 TaxID=2914041 RepID=UPI001EDC97A8|nr:type II toxin-antitoxin system VapB family antitoxin [Nostoc sp. UHCC 0870]UKO99762.1 type II toxin-antitoxin system VapB family antitoxin [Nostoc sp. UHCC 0870]